MRAATRVAVLAAGILAFQSISHPAAADDDDRRDRRRLVEYEVSITNLTRNQQFTPILIATHRRGIRFFEAGMPAGDELETLAEEGNTGPLSDRLQELRGVRDIATTSGLLDPGRTVTQRIHGRPDRDRISVAAMLIPTNDAFTALNAVTLPRGSAPAVYRSRAYDAGSERNDELCSSIPGPDFFECGGPGGGAAVTGDEEGFVHIHSGIHGVGDLDPAERDWRNPVAQISVRRIGRR